MSTPLESPAQGTSQASYPDDPPNTPFPRRFPDDILASVCAELRHMKSDSSTRSFIHPTAEDKIVQKTLLSVQLISKSGWRAATPHIWHTIRFTSRDGYYSFFAPITRLMQRTIGGDRGKRFPAGPSLASSSGTASDSAHTDDLYRFFRSSTHIRHVVMSQPLPDSLSKEIYFAHGLGLASFQTPLFLGNGVVWHLHATALARDIKRNSHDLFRGLAAACEAFRVILWDLPDDEAKRRMSWTDKAFWRNFQHGSSVWKQYLLRIRDLRPGVLHGVPFNSMDICIGDMALWTQPGSSAHDRLALDFGPWLLSGLGDRRFRLDQYPYVRNQVVISEWLGCPCGCDADSYPATDVKAVIDSIIRAGLDHLAANTALSWIGDLPGPSIEERFRIAFKEKCICFGRPNLCAAYQAHQTRVREERRSVYMPFRTEL